MKGRRPGAIGLAVAFAAAVAVQTVGTQPLRPTATVTAIAEQEDVHAGRTVRLALQVALAEGLHVQSNQPRDPAFIPTVVTIEPPPGVTEVETVYPLATDLTQAGQAAPLAVYGHEFAIGLRVTLERALPDGEIAIPARLRYQACDERLCYPPATARVAWSLRIVPSGTPTPARHADLFDRIAFRPDGARP